MKRGIKHNISLFVTGYAQVFFVAANTYFIANKIWPGVVVASFLISYIWTFNVKKVAFGNNADRLIYATGATLGAITGLICSVMIS
jgi:hypothetical protein